MNLNLSPTLRTILGVLGVFLVTLIPAGATIGIPVAVLTVLGCVAATLGYFGFIPPQVGGTQQGVVSPTLVEPPAADVVEETPPAPELTETGVRKHSIADGPAVPPSDEPPVGAPAVPAQIDYKPKF